MRKFRTTVAYRMKKNFCDAGMLVLHMELLLKNSVGESCNKEKKETNQNCAAVIQVLLNLPSFSKFLQLQCSGFAICSSMPLYNMQVCK